MPVNIRGDADAVTRAVATALRVYTDAHPAAEADVYRYSPVSVRARVIDPDFRGKSLSERHRTVWPLLAPLDEDALGELTMLLLLTPDERGTSIGSTDFDTGHYAKDYAAALKTVYGNGSAGP